MELYSRVSLKKSRKKSILYSKLKRKWNEIFSFVKRKLKLMFSLSCHVRGYFTIFFFSSLLNSTFKENESRIEDNNITVNIQTQSLKEQRTEEKSSLIMQHHLNDIFMHSWIELNRFHVKYIIMTSFSRRL